MITPTEEQQQPLFITSLSGCNRLGTSNTELLRNYRYLSQVREPAVKVMEDGRPVNLTLYSTIPIFCYLDTPREECVLGVSLLAFGAGEFSWTHLSANWLFLLFLCLRRCFDDADE